ncbi:MAG: universal stress protein [Nocardioidaceae bacterium]|nr:universal stress protein [Nocardioidaceae bacterium]
MSTLVPPAPVTVGVDGAAASHVAAQMAVRLAQQRGASVRLVHAWACPVMHGSYAGALVVRGDVVADAVVHDVLDGLDVPAGVPVHTQIEHLPAVALLERLSDVSCLIVVGRHEDRLARVATGDVAVALSSRARCPVLSVPEQWRRRSTGPRRVVVAVDTTHDSSAALALAFAEATTRGAGLVAVHAIAPTEDAHAQGAGRRQVARILKPWRAAFPGVDVEVYTDLAHPAPMLQSASRWADLLVVERPTRQTRRPRLGSVLHHVVANSKCPVIVVPAPLAAVLPSAAPAATVPVLA